MKLEKINEYKKQLTETIAAIDGEQLAALNFDMLKEMLVEITLMLERHEQNRMDLELLREDYVSRISGMEKAIAVASRRAGKVQATIDLIDELRKMPVSNLLKQYAKTQARFKDAFPTSFGFLQRKLPIQPGRSWNDYK